MDPGIENGTSFYSHIEEKIRVRAVKHGIYNLETVVKRLEYAETEAEMRLPPTWSY